jgi:hypothetical protein
MMEVVMQHVVSSLPAFFSSTLVSLYSARLLRFPASLLVLIVFLTAVVPPQPAFATMVVPVSNADLTQQATAIVIGKVKSLQTSWDLQGQKMRPILL